MRLLPVLPAVLSLAALILAFLCLFAGSKPNFMESYSILTLNTSRIGQNLISASSSSSSNNPISSFFHNLTDPIVKGLENDLNNAAASFAKDLGLQDFYSAHLMDYCYGRYTPTTVPNATVTPHKNVTHCSNRTAMFAFDPTAALQKSLNDSGLDITLSQLNWPKDLEDGIKSLRVAVKGAFVLYCIGIGLCFLTILACAFWTSKCSDGGRGIAVVEIMVAFLAFLSLGIASAITTAVAVKGDKIIDKYGKPIGVSADRGNGFLGLTWAATVLMFLASILGCVGCFTKRNRRSVKPYGEKP